MGGADVKMRFSYMVNNDGLKLIIEDSGPGISPDLKDIIFSREYTARKGYGLYLASEILDITNITIGKPGYLDQEHDSSYFSPRIHIISINRISETGNYGTYEFSLIIGIM